MATRKRRFVKLGPTALVPIHNHMLGEPPAQLRIFESRETSVAHIELPLAAIRDAKAFRLSVFRDAQSPA